MRVIVKFLAVLVLIAAALTLLDNHVPGFSGKLNDAFGKSENKNGKVTKKQRKVAPAAIMRKNADGTPVKWRTCTISFVYNPAYAPAGALTVVKDAMREVSKASGMNLKLVSVSSGERPHGNYGMYSDDPVLISFTKTNEGLLPRNALGVYQARVSEDSYGAEYYSSGILTFDANSWGTLNDDPLAANSKRSTAMHELLHAVGVGHSKSGSSLMAANAGPATKVTADVKKTLKKVVPAACQ